MILGQAAMNWGTPESSLCCVLAPSQVARALDLEMQFISGSARASVESVSCQSVQERPPATGNCQGG